VLRVLKFSHKSELLFLFTHTILYVCVYVYIFTHVYRYVCVHIMLQKWINAF